MMTPRPRRCHLAVHALMMLTSLAFAGTARAEAPVPASTSALPWQTSAIREPSSASHRTRFVIGLDKSTQFQVFSLSGPNRVIVELPDVAMTLPSASDTQGQGLIKSFRGGQSAPGKSRVVIDVSAPVVVENASVEKSKDGKSHRLVLDIVPLDSVDKSQPKKPIKAQAFGLGMVGVQPPVPKPALSPKALAERAFKPTIVIDPGHGGHDSGAQKNGTVEKEVVLAFGKLLRDKLVATGRYHVLMTRDNDTFVDLDERLAFAERSKAALFIAVHADYAGGSARGATIYSLRESVAADLKRSAKVSVAEKALSGKELAAVRQEAGEDVDTIKGILSDLAQREVEATKDRTNVFTRSVIEYMGQSTNFTGSPDRTAAFRVLKTAQFPSVLIELAYVSNREDANNLKSETWRNKVTESITTAVDNYFNNQLARLPM